MIVVDVPLTVAWVQDAWLMIAAYLQVAAGLGLATVDQDTRSADTQFEIPLLPA